MKMLEVSVDDILEHGGSHRGSVGRWWSMGHADGSHCDAWCEGSATGEGWNDTYESWSIGHYTRWGSGDGQPCPYASECSNSYVERCCGWDYVISWGEEEPGGKWDTSGSSEMDQTTDGWEFYDKS